MNTTKMITEGVGDTMVEKLEVTKQTTRSLTKEDILKRKGYAQKIIMSHQQIIASQQAVIDECDLQLAEFSE